MWAPAGGFALFYYSEWDYYIHLLYLSYFFTMLESCRSHWVAAVRMMRSRSWLELFMQYSLHNLCSTSVPAALTCCLRSRYSLNMQLYLKQGARQPSHGLQCSFRGYIWCCCEYNHLAHIKSDEFRSSNLLFDLSGISEMTPPFSVLLFSWLNMLTMW